MSEVTPAAPPSAVRIWFQRAFSPSLDPGTLLPDERSAIEVERVHGGSPVLERLLLWRRAALFVAMCFLAPAVLLQLIDTFVGMGEDGPVGELAALQLFSALGNVALTVAAFAAWRRWDRWTASRRVLFWTWLIAFVVPFLTALVPLITFQRKVIGNAEAELGVGFLGALLAFIQLSPKALSLIPGLLRAAMVAKALFPGASAPGWLILLGAPLYLLLVFIVMMMPYQLAGGGLLALSLFSFIGAPILLLRAGRRLTRPQTADEAIDTIRASRTASLLFNAAGTLFLIIGMFGVIKAINFLDVLSMLVHVIANVFVLSVIGVDTTVRALAQAHISREPPEEAALRFTYDEQMANLIRAQETLDGQSAAPSDTHHAMPAVRPEGPHDEA